MGHVAFLGQNLDDLADDPHKKRDALQDDVVWLVAGDAPQHTAQGKGGAARGRITDNRLDGNLCSREALLQHRHDLLELIVPRVVERTEVFAAKAC